MGLHKGSGHYALGGRELTLGEWIVSSVKNQKTFNSAYDAESYHVSKPASSSSSTSSTNQDSRLFSNNARRQNLFGN